MAFASPPELLDWLKDNQFLTPAQADEIAPLLAGFADCLALARELIARDWLTPYQGNQILTGKEAQLVLGAYRLRERVGEGAMGQVYKAWSLRLDRIVAVKTIHKELVNPKATDRFRREVEAAARLDHPNIALVRDADDANGKPYLVLDYIDGVNLAMLVKQQGPLPIAEAAEYARQTAVGLQHAFERGIVHRDIKPGNLIVTMGKGSQDGTPLVKILDFGLACFESENDDKTRLTQIGSLLGTVDYVAPEQAQNAGEADIRADIYSLGCTLFYLFTAQPPFPGSSVVEKLGPRVTGEAPHVRAVRPEVDPALDDVLAKMMARRPDDRYQTPIEVAQALEPFARPLPAPAPGVVMAIPVAAEAVVAGAPMAKPVDTSAESQETVFENMTAALPDKTTGGAPRPRSPSPGMRIPKVALAVGAGAFLLASTLCIGVCLIAWSFIFPKPQKTENAALRITEAKFSAPSQKLRPGESKFVLVKVERIDFKGPVTVSLHDLPDGVRSSPKVMPEARDMIDVPIIVAHGTEAIEKQTILIRAEYQKLGVSAEKTIQLTVVAK
jgi:serine/threonine-protein kinase